MVAPIPQILVNFESSLSVGLNRIDNDGFETNTSGWSVSAGIQAAGSSITRTTGGSPYMGVAVGRLVTTSTNGSGVKFVMSSNFLNGIVYTFKVFLKSVSGATTCGIRIGSLGTAGDRAVSTFTVTTSWVEYSVNFTPSADRTDIQVNVYTNSAAAMTVDIDRAEVYYTGNDISAYCDALTFEHGANFEGGLLSGSATLHLRNHDNRFTDAAPTISRLVHGQEVYIRATYSGATYGLFYGRIKRITPDIVNRMVTVQIADPVDAWSRNAEINIATSVTRSISEFRGLILDALGEPAARRSLTTGEYEADIPVTGADQADALNLLGDLDRSTATVGYLNFDPSTSVLFRYTTIARNAQANQASVETLDDVFTDYTWDDDEDSNVTSVRVTYTITTIDADQTVWTSPDLPFTVDAAATLIIWADLPAQTMSQALVSSATNTPTINFTPFGDTAKIEIIAGSASTVSDLHIDGTPLMSTTQSITNTQPVVGTYLVWAPDISATYVTSTDNALALANWFQQTHATGGTWHISVTLENTFTTQLTREIMDMTTITLPRIRANSMARLIRSVNTSVDMSALHWTTTYAVETGGPISGFILDTDNLDTDRLGY